MRLLVRPGRCLQCLKYCAEWVDHAEGYIVRHESSYRPGLCLAAERDCNMRGVAGLSSRTPTTARCLSWPTSGPSRRPRIRCTPASTAWWAACVACHSSSAPAPADQSCAGCIGTRALGVEDACSVAPRCKTKQAHRAVGMAVRAYADAHLQEAYEPALARFYMWAQTDATVFLAVHIPTGAAMHGLSHVDICVRAYSALFWLVRAHCCGLRSNPLFHKSAPMSP